jgi:hypothetical protein
MEMTARQGQDNSVSGISGPHVATLPRRPDKTHVEDMIAKSKVLARQRLAKAGFKRTGTLFLPKRTPQPLAGREIGH